MRRLSIVLVDDHSAFRESIAHVLGSREDFEVAAQFDSAAPAIEYLGSNYADLIVVDYELGQGTGGEVLHHARRIAPTARVVFLAASIPDFEVPRLIRGGAKGIVLKAAPLSEVIEALHAVAAGKECFSEAHLRLLEGPDPGPQPLTERERRIIGGVVRGLSNKEIAAGLGISEAGVKAGLQRLFEKTGVRTRAQLTRVALERFPNAWK